MKATLSPALIALASLMLTAGARAASDESFGMNECGRLVNARLARELHSPVIRPGVSTSTSDTVFVGYRAGQVGNYWKIGIGPNRPGSNTDGSWTFENPVHGDSLLGWWPFRHPHTNASSSTRVDFNRPWWAIEAGNSANYVINERRDSSDPAAPGNRTFGVVGVWHSDPGNAGAGIGQGVSWVPLSGTRSAWMGLRRHGDATVTDPLTGNPFNADALQYNGQGGLSTGGAIGTSRHFPGYGSQMDQLLYRDIDVSATSPGAGITLSFRYSTTMSTGKNTTAATRTGWFEGDPIKVPSVNDGNLISADNPPGTLNPAGPVDSFEVYIGKPVEGTFVGSDGVTRPIYDPLRRWFNEVLDRGARKWLFGAAGNHAATTVGVSISAAEKAAFTSGGHVRLVFRVHTNRGFDDEIESTYSSLGKGAAQLDDVTADPGSGPVTIGNFEGSDPLLDIDNTNAGAWHSTGKPPGILFHAHALATLPWADLCGPLNSPQRLCDMNGVVLSAGDHDNAEAMGGAPGTADEEGNWEIYSPTVCLAAPGASIPNGWDITGDMANATEDYYIGYEIYTGVFDIFATGNLWQFGFQSYPTQQSDGSKAWGEPRFPGCVFFNPDVQCFKDLEPARANGLIVTSNAGGIPDSIRIMLRRSQQCYRFGVTAGCSPTDGAYFDNVSLVLVDSPAPSRMSVNIWDWLQDTFPANETAGLPGTVAFDTTAALVRTGLNISQTGGTVQRFDVPGDSMVVYTGGDSVRMDLVFRILPGPGNYVTIGNPASGLRRVPTGTAAVTPGDGTFWGTYETSPGEFASPGAIARHAAAPGGWDPLVWNSARCDTSELNFFPVSGRGFDNQQLGPGLWMSTYGELDPRYATLGVSRNRCFVIDTLGVLGEPNMQCSGTAPGWLLTLPHARTGWDGTTATLEGTQILPDGLFTPGTHVEYFFRRLELLNNPGAAYQTCPDTGIVYPQPNEMSLDGHRWQSFSVLPDRWKDPAYGGFGVACMLYVDWNDRRGEERVWVGIADSLGATRPEKYGAHNGWHAPGGANVNDPAYFVNRNAQPGTTWDLYNVKASESLTTPAGTLGARYAYRDPALSNKVRDKYSMQAPTIAMLDAYYRVLLILTGDLNNGILGPLRDRSSDDVRMIEDFMRLATSVSPRAVFVEGDGFAESEAGQDAYHYALLTDYFGVNLISNSYLVYSGNGALNADLLPAPVLSSTDIYGIRNTCTRTFDVLQPNASVAEAEAATYYQPVGANAPFVAGVCKPSATARPWLSLLDGFDPANVFDRFGDTTHARLVYFYRVFNNLFGSICAVTGTPTVGLDLPGSAGPLADYLRLANNPLRSGVSTLRFGLRMSDRVEIRIYDVAGRRVRTLADRNFPAGEHTLTWDGTDDRGGPLPRGVYFARAHWRATGFEDAKRVVVLR